MGESVVNWWQGLVSVAVADVPDTPPSAVSVSVAGLDCLLSLQRGVTLPTVTVRVAVAGIPDFVRLIDGHVVCLN